MSAEERAKAAEEERAALEELFDEVAVREAAMESRLAQVQAEAVAMPAPALKLIVARSESVGSQLDLDEADTRALIDGQLRDAGWEVDTVGLRYSRGVRPQKNKNLAISEWPTDTGPADYALFIGLDLVGIVEAKRAAKDVAASLEQSKRYSRGWSKKADEQPPGGPWGEYKVPFLFATKGTSDVRDVAGTPGGLPTGTYAPRASLLSAR